MTLQILTVCTGNICRSPMAERMLRSALRDAGLEGRAEVHSAATTSEEIGNPMDARAAAVLRARGIDAEGHRARRMTPEMLREAHLIIAMDHDHIGPIRRLLEHDGASLDQIEEKLRMIRSFDPEAPEDDLGIRDPWYGSAAGFETTWDQLEAAIAGILDEVRERTAPQPGAQA